MGVPAGLKMWVQFQNVTGVTNKVLATLEILFTLLHDEQFENELSPVILNMRLRNLGQGNQMIVAMSSISESSVFKMFSDHNKPQNRHFQIPLV